MECNTINKSKYKIYKSVYKSKHKSKYKLKHMHIALLLVILSVSFLSIVHTVTNKSTELVQGTEEKEQWYNEIILLLEQSMSREEVTEMVKYIDPSLVIKEHIDDYVLIQVEKEEELGAALEVLSNHDQVRLAEVNGIIEAFSISTDYYSESQWALHNSGEYLSFGDADHMYQQSKVDVDMDAPEGWMMLDAMANPKEVIVASLDTGVDIAHEDLKDQIWINFNEIPGDGIDNDENGYIDDINGWDFYNKDSSVGHFIHNKDGLYSANPEDNDNHGTHIAGIIGAKSNNGLGIAGVASKINIRLMVLKVNGGTKGTGSISSAIEGIKYATLMGADICNLSWGTSQNSLALEQVMRESDMLFVTAAGNTGADNDQVAIYPANYQLDNMIAVTYINADGKLARKSNYSPLQVDIAAPGEDIFSTIVGSYGYMTGSSMAAPHVTGLAALLYSYQDHVYPANIKDVILASLKPLESLEGKVKYAGIPSISFALENKSMMITDTKLPKVSLSTGYNKDKMIVKVKGKDTGKSGIRVIKWLSGKRVVKDFNRGMNGFPLINEEISVSKAGNYTIYISDYAGNEYIKVYKVKADQIGPNITSSYRVSKTYKTRTISINVSDTQSGVKRVKYMSGNRKPKEFLPAGAGTEVKLSKGKAEFHVKKDGTYTIFASDHRGNLTVSTIQVKTVKATDVKFVRSYRNMKIGESHILNAFLKPSNTTDTMTYISSNPKVATVTKSGRVTAVAEGYTYVVVTTASGKSTVCKIIVKK